MDITVTGIVRQALPVQQGVSQKTGNQWSRATYIVEHEHGQWPRSIAVDVLGDKIGQFDLKVGDNATFHLNVDVREYGGRYFNSIEVWKVERYMAQDSPQPQDAPQPAPQSDPLPQYNADELPFG